MNVGSTIKITSGNLKIMQEGEKILRERVDQVRSYVQGRLKRPFPLESPQHFERDAEKRSRAKALPELYQLWDQILLVDVIDNYLDLEEEGDESLQKGEEKKKKVAKKTKKAKKTKCQRATKRCHCPHGKEIPASF